MKAPALINEPDVLVDGFERIDSNLLESRAPRLKFLPGFHEKSDDQKIAYLIKLASTMNHAAKLAQDERDQLAKLMELKERQLEKVHEAMRQNNQMIQVQVAQMNEERQHFNAQSARNNARIKHLETELRKIADRRIE